MTRVKKTPERKRNIHRPTSMGATSGRNNPPFHSPTTPRFDPAGLYFFVNDVLAGSRVIMPGHARHAGEPADAPAGGTADQRLARRGHRGTAGTAVRAQPCPAVH